MANRKKTALECAQRHLAIGERLIAVQKAIIERLRSRGYSTRDAERLLATLEETLRLMRMHLAHEQERAAMLHALWPAENEPTGPPTRTMLTPRSGPLCRPIRRAAVVAYASASFLLVAREGRQATRRC